MTTQQTFPELINQLKQLKLTGMAEHLHARNQEAITNQMSYGEFLQLLTQDELLAREQRRYERRYQQANFKGTKRIENFDFNFNPQINQKLIRDLATCRFIQEKAPVLITGPCGTGKTHIAHALGHCAIQKGYNVRCTTQTELADTLQTAKAVNGYRKKLQSLAKLDLLIIDDFGLKPFQSPQDEDLHELIAERYEKAPTLVTSNLAIEEWQQAFPNKLLGAATIDRLQDNAYITSLEGQSYRKAKKQS